GLLYRFEVLGRGLSSIPDIFKSKCIGDDSSPTVGAEFSWKVHRSQLRIVGHYCLISEHDARPQYRVASDIAPLANNALRNASAGVDGVAGPDDRIHDLGALIDLAVLPDNGILNTYAISNRHAGIDDGLFVHGGGPRQQVPLKHASGNAR